MAQESPGSGKASTPAAIEEDSTNQGLQRGSDKVSSHCSIEGVFVSVYHIISSVFNIPLFDPGDQRLPCALYTIYYIITVQAFSEFLLDTIGTIQRLKYLCEF